MSIKRRFTVWFVLQSALLMQAAFPQCENKTGFAKQVCLVQNANSNTALNQSSPGALNPPALTTGFADTIHPDTLPATVEPKAFVPLAKLERTDDGAFILKLGIYEAYLQSYSLDPNDLGAGRVAGFYPAPIKGRYAKVIQAALKQAELHPDVPQSDIQSLLWAIVSGTDLDKMPPNVQQTAARVLPHDVLTQLMGATQAKAAQAALMGWLNQKINKDPALRQKIAQADEAAKQLQQNAAAGQPTFRDSAAFAEPVVRGTWAMMPGGFYVRYLPENAARIRVQVIVPDVAIEQADPQHPLVFDPTQFLAVYSQSPALRLGVTMRPAGGR